MTKDRFETVEEALVEMAHRIASPKFGTIMRQIIDAGENVKCQLTIKKTSSAGHVVALDYRAESPKRSCGTLMRLS